jgi:hypothetical protein
MFNFSTTTIVNSAASLDAAQNGRNAALIATLVKHADNATGFYQPGVEEKKASATITVPTVAKGDILRLSINVKLTNSANSLYANAFVQKGKPFSAEAIAPSTTPADAAKAIVEVFNKYQILVCESAMLKISYSGAVITVNATSGHQVIDAVVLEKWDATKEEWTAVATPKIEAGAVGFGDYSYIIRNLRVPTGANTRFGHILEDEAPVAGALYDQYIFNMEVERGIMGGDAMGQIATSRTTHVFWVKNGVDVSAYFSAPGNATSPKTASAASIVAPDATSANILEE